jgi:hypothetical protein
MRGVVSTSKHFQGNGNCFCNRLTRLFYNKMPKILHLGNTFTAQQKNKTHELRTYRQANSKV